MRVKQGTFSADGSTEWFNVASHPLHIAINGTWGGGSIAIEQEIQGTVSSVLDEGSVIAITANDNSAYNFQSGDTFRLTLSGSTSPDLDWKVTGVV